MLRASIFIALILMMTPIARAGDQVSGTHINLSATAESMAANDEVVVTFRIQARGTDATQLRQSVNRTATAIAGRLKQESGVLQKTINRNMQPTWKYPKNGERVRTGWQLTQTEQATSRNLEAVPHWLDAIEAAGAELSGLRFRLSDERARDLQSQLRMQAVAAFRKQATEMARSLDADSFRIVRLNTNSAMPRPVMMRAEMAMADSVAAEPALSAGEGKIGVTVSGEIELPFRDFPAR